MLKSFFLCACTTLFLASCAKQHNGYTIAAQVIGFKNGSKVILTNADTGKKIDTTFIKENTFTSKGVLDESPAVIDIIIKDTEENLVYTALFIGNESINISGSKSDFPDKLLINGSKHHTFKSKLDTRIASLDKERNLLLQEMFARRQAGTWSDSLQNAYWNKETGFINVIDLKTDSITATFIEEHINSDYALRQLVSLKNTYDAAFIKKQLIALNRHYKQSSYATVLKTFLDNKPLEEGDLYYDFVAENQDGKSQRFSELFTDKFVLLEFYSPYCSWCVKALPEIKKLAVSQAEKLQVVTFNVDKNKEDWLLKYKANSITWTSFFDSKGRHSEVYTKYRVSGTPTYYLFDKNGKFLKMWNGYDEEFIKTIKALVSE